MKQFELVPQFENHDTFYHKAELQQDECSIKLLSYKQPLAIKSTLTENSPIHLLNKNPKTISKTSMRHLREFMRQFGNQSDQKLADCKKDVIVACLTDQFTNVS